MSAPSPRRALLLIALVALVLMGPELVTGLSVSYSFRYNITWTEQFTDLFRAGDPYPRWLPHSWAGLGSPAFYFYPPLFFWVAGLIDAATGGLLPAERVAPLASLVMMAASGIAMLAWLKAHVGERRALIGALAYMAAPYHLYDIYARGALAEASAYAAVPLVMLGLARLGDGRGRYVMLVAFGYAALLFAHLPIALLASLFVIPPYVAFQAIRMQRPLRFLLLALAGGLFGLALAAVYLVPAIGLLPHISSQGFTTSFYSPQNNFFWRPHAWPAPALMLLIVPLSLGALLLAAAGALAARVLPVEREALFWAAVTLLLLLLVSGFLPPLWQLPGMSLVQFPSRALLLVEFTVVTLLAMTAPPPRSRAMLAGAAALAFAYIILGILIAQRVAVTWTTLERDAAQVRTDHREAPEYLPAGTRLPGGKEGPDPSLVRLPEMPLAKASPDARVAAAGGPDGEMRVRVESSRPTRVAVRRFYFPHWRVLDAQEREVPVAPSDDRLVSWQAPAGRSSYRLVAGSAPFEREGLAVSAAALLLIAGIALALGARSRARKD